MIERVIHALTGLSCDPETGLVYGLRVKRPIGALTANGYLNCAVYIGGKRTKHYLHRIVFEAVHGPLSPSADINHINGIKTDNRICNLEAVTRSENIQHAYRTGLTSGARALSREQVQQIRETKGRVAGCDLSRELGVSEATISEVRNGKTYKCYGSPHAAERKA